MRRSSLLSILLIAGLVVCLAGGVTVALTVTELPSDFTWEFNPAEYQEKTHNDSGDPFSIKIAGIGGNTSWTLDESLTWDTPADAEVTRALNDAFNINYDLGKGWEGIESVEDEDGQGVEYVNLKFIWDPDELSNGENDFQYLEAGEYTVTVTLTVSA